ncbi:hypothetical protein GDO81_004648 [Engystomops pustulosus]|uniref:Aminopeptidase NAALADL1 n=1 Tax=Engystomops pustulosus TaxID=76066 RepID=A0AAV7CHJ3_ENGPU|nr:hypothetical protein GDO81_004648 [Engystomops pustulosus]KAG8584533.1 hypothetical protein GDO81_004648 [Engystomops pustulosus]
MARKKGIKRTCLVVIMSMAVLFLLGVLVGWLVRPSVAVGDDTGKLLNIEKELMSEMKAENIRTYLRDFTKIPHLAGTEQNLRLAQKIQSQWKEFGLDKVELVHYDVLLSYPNETRPNYICIIDEQGTEIFNTSLSEPPPEGYENFTDIVPPYNAFSAKGEPEGELVYVNYGRTEDFFFLERNLSINCTGKIVIARYGKIFRGNKVRMHVYTNNQVNRIYNVIGTIRGAENAKILQERGVAYINSDSALEGNYTLRVDCTPLMYRLVYNVTKRIASPDEGFSGQSLYDSWLQKSPSPQKKDLPRINKLGSGSDFEAYFQRLGLASGRARYTKNDKTDKYSNYPVYHTVYETFELVERFYDPSFKKHLSVAQVRGSLVYELADSTIIPYNAQDYAEELKNYADSISNLAKKYAEQMAAYDVTFEHLYNAINDFTASAAGLHQRIKNVNYKDPMAVRILNDQLMYAERAFTDPLGLPGRPFYRHIIFAPSSQNKYAGESFPGIFDAMFDIESKEDQQAAWEEVKRQIAIATFTIQAAGDTLKEV